MTDKAAVVRELALDVLRESLAGIRKKIAAGAPIKADELDHVLAVAKALAPAGAGKLPRAKDIASPGKSAQAIVDDVARLVPEIRDVLKNIQVPE